MAGAEFEHIPVLYNETITSLNIKEDGIYVDATAGGGGHSRGILENSEKRPAYLCGQRPGGD